MNIINKILCKLLGHVMFSVFTNMNHRSKWGEHKCSRCGYIETWQYDYEHYNPEFKE